MIDFISIDQSMVIIRGAGDLATGIGHRLHKSGYKVVMLEVAQPTVIRRTVAFANAVFEGVHTVEGVTARLAQGLPAAINIIAEGEIPVLVDPMGKSIRVLKPGAVIDCILAKKNLGTSIDMAPVVIGVGPGFQAPADVHAVIESKRGHDLGRVILSGAAIKDTGVPGDIKGYTHQRLLKACSQGVIINHKSIGDMVKAGDLISTIQGQEVRAEISGVLRGLLKEGLQVYEGMKIGDIDPRGEASYCFTISDKARAIAGGALEALLQMAGCTKHCHTYQMEALKC